MSDYLILAPHADDEVLGCGATISKLCSEGHNVTVAILTNASVGAPELFDQRFINRVRKEALKAHEKLGINKTVFYDLPAPCLEQYPQYKIAEVISATIKKFDPEVIFTSHRGDLHMDHGAVFNATMVAARPFPGSRIRKIFSYETLSETEWGHSDDMFIPNYFTPIDKLHFDKKISAMKSYVSQLKESPHPRSLDAIKTQLKSRGSMIGHKYAEAFILVRAIDCL